MKIPTRVTVSDGRVFVLGQTNDGSAVVCEVSPDARIRAETHLPRSGTIADLAVVGSGLCVSIVPDVTATNSAQESEVIFLAPGGAVTARRRFESPGFTTALKEGVVISDSRADGRHLVAMDSNGEQLWERRLASASPILAVVAIQAGDGVFVVQDSGVTVVTAESDRAIRFTGTVLSQG
jgi:outer membrane protein assembly factor BamB